MGALPKQCVNDEEDSIFIYLHISKLRTYQSYHASLIKRIRVRENHVFSNFKKKGNLTKAEKKRVNHASPMIKKRRTMLLVLLRQEEKGEPCISNFEAKGESCFRQLLSIRRQRGSRKGRVNFSSSKEKGESCFSNHEEMGEP